ncbi:MAG: hypothetical protein ACKO4Q_06630 [Planctomycetota bacterium]
MSAFCPHCGQPTHAGAAFCPATGASLAPSTPPPRPGPAPMPPPPLEEYGPGGVILLSFLTCGIFGVVRFYQCAQAYRRELPGAAPNFEWQFWTYVIASLVGAVTSSFGIGFVLLLGAVVIGALMLSEVCAAREELARRTGVAPHLTSSSTQVTLWVLGEVLALVVVGLVLIVIQGLQFFEDHNTVVRALRKRAT